MKTIKTALLIVSCIILTNCSLNDFVIKEVDSESAKESTASDAKPNILLIIADDMGIDATPGYDLIDANGDVVPVQKPTMPNLERLMANGIKCSNFWTAPSCAPTRAAILSGKYGLRTGIFEPSDGTSFNTNEITIQEHLKANNAGYATSLFGKWHLTPGNTAPNNEGIDYFASNLSANFGQYDDWTLTEQGVSTDQTDYLTNVLTNKAIDWIAAQGDNNWFAWMAYNTPHSPFHVPPADLYPDLVVENPNTNLGQYLAMMGAMDIEMGRLIDSMSPEVRENTIIIFMGDNGTASQVVQGYPNGHQKGRIYEAGMNAPLVISGPGIRSGVVEDALINHTDLYNTIADISGVPTSTTAEDSQSFKDFIFNDTPSPREYLYAERPAGAGFDLGIRNATHHYILFANGNEELYNIENMHLEVDNLLENPTEEIEAIKTELVQAMAEVRGE